VKGKKVKNEDEGGDRRVQKREAVGPKEEHDAQSDATGERKRGDTLERRDIVITPLKRQGGGIEIRPLT